MKKILFKNCKFLFLVPTAEGIVTGQSVLTEGPNILAIGNLVDLEKEFPDLGQAEIIDCSNKIVMPGLVDGHNHLCNTHMNVSRAFPFDYTKLTEHMLTTIHDPYGWLTKKSIYDITMTSIINDVKHGATTIENSTILPDTAFRAMTDAGIRGILAPQMATSFRLDADNLNMKQSLEKTRSCLKQYHHPDGTMQVVVHIHDLWDCTEKMMLAGMELASEYDTKYVAHFWEFASAQERGDILWADEGGAFEHYRKRGLINDRCVFFHGSMLNEEQIDQLASLGASIIHNPDINATNCGNCAYIPKMLEAGVNVGLGCDYGSLDVMTNMKLMLLVHHIMPRRLRTLEYWKPFEAATMGSARAYGLDHMIGSLETGKRADIITIDLSKASHLLPMCTELIGIQTELLYFLFTRNCAGTETCETMINGRFVRRNGEFTQLDEEKLVAEASAWCGKCLTDLIQRRKDKKHYARIIHPDFTKDEDIPTELLN